MTPEDEALTSTLRRDLRTVVVALTPAVRTIAQAAVTSAWLYVRDRQHARLRAWARGDAVRLWDIAHALDPRRRPTCPPPCSEGHTFVWPCELGPVLPRPDTPDHDDGHAEAPDWWDEWWDEVDAEPEPDTSTSMWAPMHHRTAPTPASEETP